MGVIEKSLVIWGQDGAGKDTILGCMLFNYGAIDLLMLENFEQEGIKTYEQVAKKLKSLDNALSFHTPKHHITVMDIDVAQADCAILVLSADALISIESFKEKIGAAKQLIMVINKMDDLDWSEDQYKRIVDEFHNSLENIPIIPISAEKGDNVVDKSSNSTWYEGWKKNGQSGATLLEALEVSFQI